MGQATSVETPFAPAFFGRSARRAPRNGGRRLWQGRASARRRTTGSRAVELVAGLSNDEAAEPWRFGAGARQTLPKRSEGSVSAPKWSVSDSETDHFAPFAVEPGGRGKCGTN
jgi:hypothetical protein